VTVDSSIVRYHVDENEPVSSAIIAALPKAKGRDVTAEECIL
jgi:hypothetical protein